MFDLHGALMRKQEYECARLDAFQFRLRVLTVRLAAELLRQQGHDVPDAAVVAGTAVTASEEAVLEQLYVHVRERVSPARYRAVCAHARQAATDRLKRVWGDPTPHALA